MKKKQKIWIALAIISMIIFLICVCILIRRKPSTLPVISETSSVFTASSSEEPLSSKAEQPYVSPIDFKHLQSINPDIYAWITIPGTNIDYPIMQSKEDNEYYLKHNADKEYTKAGGIFTENYNAKDFNDPITVVYGHNYYPDDTRFSQLHKFSEKEFFDKNKIIKIFLPEKLLQFSIALVYNNIDEHLLHNRDYTNEVGFQAFVDNMLNNRDIGEQRDQVLCEQISYGDKLLVLSTCNKTNEATRFLVIATLNE